jgi:threonine synthase
MKKLLQDYKAGKVDLSTVLQKLKSLPYEDLEFAKIDTHREVRKGFPETIFCQGKTISQISQIIKKLPKLLGVQSNACCPIYKAYINEKNEIIKYTQKKQTIAEGICSEKPIRDKLILKALKETKGAFTTVSDNEIIKGTKSLAIQGLYVEPTSAVVLPAVDKFYNNKIINHDQTIVIILTGSGLKSTEKIVKMFHKYN